MSHNTVRRLAALAAAAGTLAVIAACSSSTSPASGNGTLAVQLTDAPFLIDSVKSVDVFVLRIDGRMTDADSATSAKGAGSDSSAAGGWTTLATPNASFNLLAYQNGATISLGQQSVPAGSYLGFRLVIDPSRSSVTLKTNQVLTGISNPNVSFPSGATSGLKIKITTPVKVVAGATTTFVVDFDLANSFVLRGNSIGQNGLLFKPVINATTR